MILLFIFIIYFYFYFIFSAHTALVGQIQIALIELARVGGLRLELRRLRAIHSLHQPEATSTIRRRRRRRKKNNYNKIINNKNK